MNIILLDGVTQRHPLFMSKNIPYIEKPLYKSKMPQKDYYSKSFETSTFRGKYNLPQNFIYIDSLFLLNNLRINETMKIKIIEPISAGKM